MDAAFQTAFVRLVTLDAARQAFADDPVAAAAHLPEPARSALRDLDPLAVSRYAESLKAKRWRSLSAVIPLTRRICPSIGTHYRAWLGAHPSPGDRMGLSPGESEGLRCLPALRQALRGDEGTVDWAPDLLAFEVLGACSRRDGTPRQMQSRVALHDCVQVLRSGGIPLDPEPDPHRYRFERRGVKWKRL
jgi:hypothetical protein